MSLDTRLVDQTLVYVAYLFGRWLIIFNNSAVLAEGGVCVKYGDVQVQPCVYVVPKVYQSSDPQK